MGCITLVMACVALGVWFRSSVVEDNYFIGDGDASGPAEFQFVSSTIEGIAWTRESVPEGLNVEYPRGWYSYYYENGRSTNAREVFDPTLFEWRWRICGFECAVLKEQRDLASRISYWIVPYWALIWPPLLMSAYLMLWKPRKLAGVRPTITN